MTTSYRTRDLSRLTLSDLRSFVGASWSRKLAHNTYVEQLPHGELAIRFHSTRILTFSVDGSFVARTGGYETVTTKQRLNALMPAGYRIYAQGYYWYISTPEGTFPFRDGQRWGGIPHTQSGEWCRCSDCDENTAREVRERAIRGATPVGYMELGPNGFDLHLFGQAS